MSEPQTTGGCLCGNIRYEAAETPYNITHCHCVDCRKSSGAAFVTWATFHLDYFRVTAGKLREVRWADRIRAFCPDCGTPITFRGSDIATEIDVTVCSFDHPERVVPEDHTWVEDRLPWSYSGLPEFPRERTGGSNQ